MLKTLFLVFGGPVKDNLSGTSSSSGFLIKSRGETYTTFWHIEGDEIPSMSTRTVRTYLFSVVLVALLVASLMFFSHLPIVPRVFLGLILWILGGIIGGAVLSMILPFRSACPRWPMYHAAEHKAICMLQEGLEPTQENFKKCPKITMGCGSVYISMFFFSIPFMVACLIASDIFFHWDHSLIFTTFFLLFFSCILSFLMCALGAYMRDRASKMINFMIGAVVLPLLVIGAPMTFIPMIFERVLCLKEPTPDIIDEAILLVRRVRITQEIKETWGKKETIKAS